MTARRLRGPESVVDFTEKAYRKLLASATDRYSFARFTEHATAPAPCAIWRHDVDVSPQRALALARMENEAGVPATYFFHLHGDFYNLLETEVARVIDTVLELGHSLGLHFDPHHYAARGADPLAHLDFERQVLERQFGQRVEAFSIHNPTVTEWVDGRDEIAGMVNAGGLGIASRYTYCSDSNGLWRYSRLQDLIADAQVDRLHALTHPEWWTPETMPPRARIARAAHGRAAAAERRYDEFLARHGRPNVRQ